VDLSHQFTVPTQVEETWAHFQDIASVAQCFPGAQVTSAEGDSFSGTVKVKLGPIALVYNGSGTFVEKDDEAHRFVVDAKGKDKRGNGTAGAKVTLTMAEASGGGTDVRVDTDLAITGKPAQFGRGVMQDVSDKLLGQFVSGLEQRLGDSSAPAAEEPPAAATPAGSAASTPDPAPAPAAAGAGSARPAEPTRPAPAATPLRPAPPPPQADDSLDLGATVLPVLLKGYWKQGLAAAVVLAVLLRLLRRR
jgi:uncharacterized protein